MMSGRSKSLSAMMMSGRSSWRFRASPDTPWVATMPNPVPKNGNQRKMLKPIAVAIEKGIYSKMGVEFCH